MEIISVIKKSRFLILIERAILDLTIGTTAPGDHERGREIFETTIPSTRMYFIAGRTSCRALNICARG